MIFTKEKTSLFIGYFTDLTELQAQYPVGEDGQYAGVNDVKKKYYWDVSSRAWTDSGESFTGVIQTGDIEIGAVEIKDGSSDNRAAVDASGRVSTNIGSVGGTTVPTKGSTPVVPSMIVDASGNQIVSFGSPSTIADYKSPTDFTATYTSASTITLTGLPYTLSTGAQIVYIKVRNSSTNITTIYTHGASGYAFAYSSGVVTAYKDGVASSIFTSNDMYEVGVNGPLKSYDGTLDITKTINQSPDRSSYVQDSLLDITNIAAATNFYPSSTGFSMDGYRGLSLSGKFIDADGTMTMTIEAMNDEDRTNGDWIDVTKTFFDDKAGTLIATANVTVTNGTATFALSKEDFNYSNVRIKMVNDGATNTGIIKMRRKSL